MDRKELPMGFDIPFSERSQDLKPSPIREIFKLTQRPGMISFAGGLPDPAIFPIEQFSQCSEILAREGKTLLQYGPSEGYSPLLDIVSDMMEKRLGRRPDPAELLISSGSQHAANLIARALIDPGDVVIVEAPTYPGTLHTFRNLGARFASVPCDGQGMIVEQLPDVIAHIENLTGKPPKLIYTIPDFSNPTGACLSLERRKKLIEIASERSILVFEDDPYSKLRYKGEEIPPLKALDQTGSAPILYASSFSKILAPGVRVAWSVGPQELIRAMVLIRQGEDLCTSTVTQALVANYCRSGFLEDHLTKIIEHYKGKRDAMEAALVKHVPENSATWHEPEGGFFFWLKLAGFDSKEVFTKAVEHNVAFLPGGAFYPRPDEQVGEPALGSEFARLCFTFASPDQIEEGIQRFAQVLASL